MTDRQRLKVILIFVCLMFFAILTLCIATPQIKLAFMKVSFEWLDRLEAPEVDY